MSVATVCLWCGILLVTLTFLTLVNTLTAPGVFLLYATVSIAAFLFVWRAVPKPRAGPWKKGCRSTASMLMSRGFRRTIPAEARGVNTGVGSLSENW